MQEKYDVIILLVHNTDLSEALGLYRKLNVWGKRVLIIAREHLDMPHQGYALRDFQFYRDFLNTDYSKISRRIYDLFESLGSESIGNSLTLPYSHALQASDKTSPTLDFNHYPLLT